MQLDLELEVTSYPRPRSYIRARHAFVVFLSLPPSLSSSSSSNDKEPRQEEGGNVEPRVVWRGIRSRDKDLSAGAKPWMATFDESRENMERKKSSVTFGEKLVCAR